MAGPLAHRFIAKPLLAAVLVGAATWAGASPAGVPPHHEAIEAAAAELPIPVSSTTTTTESTTTTTVAPPPTTVAPAPPTTAPRPATTTTTRKPSGPVADAPVPRAPVAA